MSHTFEQIQSLLSSADIASDPCELHGVISGMICGGTPSTADDWMPLVEDVINEGQRFERSFRQQLLALQSSIRELLLEDEFGFQPMLPDDDEALEARAQGIVQWLHGFLVGFGLNQKDLSLLSQDTREVVDTFVELCRMDTSEEESEEAEEGLFTIVEYIRLGATALFQELGQGSKLSSAENKTIH